MVNFSKEIEIEIVDNDVYEDDEQFYVQLTHAKAYCATNEEQIIPCELNKNDNIATVIIIDDGLINLIKLNSNFRSLWRV